MNPGRPKAEADWEALADRYLSEFEVRVNTSSQGRPPDIFVYEVCDSGLYSFGEQEIKRILKVWSRDEGSQIKRQSLMEAIEHIRDLSPKVSNDLINGDPDRLHLANGILNLITMTVEPFSSAHFSTVKIPVKYDPTCDCHNVKILLRQILPDEADRKTFWEFLGFNHVKGYPYHKALLCQGAGRNGKSTLFDIVTEYLGSHNVTGKEIYEFLQSFGTDNLFGRLANLSTDLPSKKITNSAAFKRLFGDWLSAQRKNRSDLEFKNFAKFWISCNELFEVEDQTEGWYRRWVIIKFTQRFEEGSKSYLPRDKLISLCTTDEEKSGILNEALKGLDRLNKQGKFTNDNGVEAVSTWWTKTANPLGEFAQKYIEITGDKSDAILKSEFTHNFRFISKKHLSPQQINKRVMMYLRGVTQGHKKEEYYGDDGKKHTTTKECWRGMRWSEEALKTLQAINDNKKESNPKKDPSIYQYSEKQVTELIQTHEPEGATAQTSKISDPRMKETHQKVLDQILQFSNNGSGVYSHQITKRLEIKPEFMESYVNDLCEWGYCKKKKNLPHIIIPCNYDKPGGPGCSKIPGGGEVNDS